MPRSDGSKALPAKGRGTPRNITPRLPDSCGKPRSIPGARATQRLRPRVTSATSTITATVEPTSTRRCTEATTPGVGDTTTAGRIGVPRPNHSVRRLSTGPYDGRRSRPGSEPRLLSQSTQGRQGRNCGSRTNGWPATWVERMMTTSSSATSPCSSPSLLEPGWSICLRGRPPTGTTWSKPLPATSRARTCAPGNSWDLRSCRQQPGESLRDYIQRFSKQRTELPNVTDSDVIGAFLAGTTCRDLVSKLGHKTPTRASELMDIATKFASGQEAIEAIFRKDK
jgi:hypothetical protein